MIAEVGVPTSSDLEVSHPDLVVAHLEPTRAAVWYKSKLPRVDESKAPRKSVFEPTHYRVGKRGGSQLTLIHEDLSDKRYCPLGGCETNRLCLG